MARRQVYPFCPRSGIRMLDVSPPPQASPRTPRRSSRPDRQRAAADRNRRNRDHRREPYPRDDTAVEGMGNNMPDFLTRGYVMTMSSGE
jgi:hypothetical protein